MERAGLQAGDDFSRNLSRGIEQGTPRAQAALVRLTSTVNKLRDAEADLARALKSDDYDRLVTASTKVERAHRNHEAALRSLAAAQAAASQGATTLASTIGDIVAPLGKVAGPAAIGGVVSVLGQLTGVAASATGALGTIPAVAVAGGAALGTLKIATMGFGDAMDSITDPEKFAEALQKLSPAAQQVALQVQDLIPVFDQLKQATQESLFSGLAPQLGNLANAYQTPLQQLTTGVAGGLNAMASGALQQLTSPDTLAQMNATIDNIVTAFQNLGPAVAPLTRVFAELVNEGSSFLPQLAMGATQAAQAFSDLVRSAAQSGRLAEWMQLGVDTLHELWPLVENTSSAFMELATNKEGVRELVNGINGLVNLLPTVIKLTEEWTGPLSTAGNIIGAISNALPDLGTSGQSVFGVLTQSAEGLLNPLKQIWDILGTIMKGLGVKDIGGVPLGGIDVGGNLQQQVEAMRDRALAQKGFAPDGSSLNPMFGPPGAPGPGFRLPPGSGGIGTYATPRMTGPSSWGGSGNPFAWEPPKSGSGGSSTAGSVTPYTGDPMSLLGGVNVTSGLYSSASSVLAARHDVEEKQAQLNKLQASNTATGEQLQKAKNDLAEAQQKSYEAELRLNEQRLSSTERYTKQLDSAAGTLGNLGTQLDSDFGLSKGLPGIVENITKFIGNLAAAPYLGQLQAIVDADPRKGGFGAMGILGAQGAFGPDHTGLPASYGMPGGASYGAPVGAVMPGESARDFAHRVMMPYWQSQGLTVGDHGADKYGEHQNGALDIMVSNLAEGNRVLQQVLSDPNVYGAIFNQRSYGYGHGTAGTPMEDRGNPTQNHQDHVHAFYKPGGPNNIVPQGSPIGMPSGAMPDLTMPTMPSPMSGLPLPLPVVVVGGGLPAPVGGPPVAPGVPAPGMPPATPPPPGGPALGSPASGAGLGPLPGPQAWGAPGLPSIVGGGGEGPVLGGPTGPGVGNAAGAPVGKAAGAGGWQPQGGGGIGPDGGGAIGMAMDAGSLALDAMAPGSGQAAQTAMKLINRSIQYGSQVASIGVSGLLETFGLNDTQLGDPSKSWLGRAAAGVAGAAPALPTSAGQSKPPADPNQNKDGQQGQQQAAIHIENWNQSPDRRTEQSVKDLQAKGRAAAMKP